MHEYSETQETVLSIYNPVTENCLFSTEKVKIVKTPTNFAILEFDDFSGLRSMTLDTESEIGDNRQLWELRLLTGSDHVIDSVEVSM